MSQRRQKGSGRVLTADLWLPELQTSRWEPGEVGPHRNSKGMPCQRRRKREFSSTSASPTSMWDGNSASWSHRASEDFFSKCILLLDVFWAPVAGKQEDASHTHATETGDTCFYRKVYFSMVQSCIKLEVGRKDADTSLPLSHPSHSMSLVHNNGISQGGRQNTITVGCQREREQLHQRLVCHDGCRHLGYKHLDFHSTWKTPTLGTCVTVSSD